MKQYTIVKSYRGQQYMRVVWAKSKKEAAETFGVSMYYLNNYAGIIDFGETFTGIKAYFDGGMLWEKEKHLLRDLMEESEMRALIDKYKDA